LAGYDHRRGPIIGAGEDGIMARYRGTALSELSAEETFDYLAEFSSAAEWDPGVSGAQRLDDGPVGLGSAFRLDVSVAGRAVPLDYRVVSYQRPHRVVLLGENDTIRSEDTVTVAPRTGGGSVLTYDADLRLKGVAAVFNPFLAIPFRRIGDRGLSGLRRVLSAGAADATPPPSAGGGVLADIVDKALEATVVGSFTSVGPAVRGYLAGWGAPPSLRGKVVLITGATSGLGLASAVGMARLGATVVFVARNRGRAEQARADILEAAPDADVSFLLADMGELDQVREAAARFIAEHDRLDVLVHNAGALTVDYTTTSAGTEVTVASQLIAPFLLTGLLLPRLVEAVPSKVIQVSSGGMYTQKFDLATLESGPDGYDGAVAYARTKRAQLVLMHEWVRRYDGSGISFHAMHPGWADTPGIRAGLPGFANIMSPLLRTPEQGADTVVWLAADSEAVATTGGFWLDRRRRWENKVPWTRLDEDSFVEAGSALWSWCAERSGWDDPPPAATPAP
jgi:NAD(P)-dependent dehydrogenase (short-subunit alcohol dehydrogenase family)